MVTSHSNNIYELYDDFSGTTLDTNKWIIRGSFTTLKLDNGILIIAGNENWEYIKSIKSWDTTIVFEAKVKYTGNWGSEGPVFSDKNNDNRYTIRFDRLNDNTIFMVYDINVHSTNAMASTYPGIHLSLNKWYIIRAIIKPTGDGIEFIKYCVDNTCARSTKLTNVPIKELSVGFSLWSSSEVLYIDWVNVYKYDTKPIVTTII